MAKENFSVVHPWVLAHEGGYVNHPKDPGGATNYGVTQRTYDAFRKLKGQAARSVKLITAAERDAIYKTQYWDKISGDQLPYGVDYCVYDYAVNSGPSRSAKELQRVVGVTADGVIGVQTLSAVAAKDPTYIVTTMCNNRMAFLRGLSIWPTFKNGWTRRVMGNFDGPQSDDLGVIDRGVMLTKMKNEKITAPKVVNDGAAAKAPDVSGIINALMSFLRSLF